MIYKNIEILTDFTGTNTGQIYYFRCFKMLNINRLNIVK